MTTRNTTTVTASRTATTSAAQPKKQPEEDYSKYVKKGISQEAVTRLKECFDIFDADHSGEVTTLELKNAIIALGIQLSLFRNLKRST